MEISFKNKNKNSTFRSLQSMICYVTNWRIINAPLKLRKHSSFIFYEYLPENRLYEGRNIFYL